MQKLNLEKKMQKENELEKLVMEKVKSGKVTMKPKWLFIAGSFFSVVGLAGLSVASVFLINLMLFLLCKHGPMGQWRIETMINSFPWWIPILAIAGIAIGICLLKKYDFSYKKNFLVIAVGFIASILIAGIIINCLGLNEVWSHKKMMRKFYQKIENRKNVFPVLLEKERLLNNRGNGYTKNK